MPNSISISKAQGKPGHVYHPLSLDIMPKPEATGTQVVVKMHTAALNHKDIFTRQGLYPNIGFGVTQPAGSAGTVVEVGPQADRTWYDQEKAPILINEPSEFRKPGGIISCYGMTVAPKVLFTVQAVMRNIEFGGSTMGSRKEFSDMVRYVDEKKIKPVVSKVAKGLELPGIEDLYEEIEKGAQFGKLVVEISQSRANSKLSEGC
ncbi:zinc-binding dehydrogenase [Acrodontium crateriforme]|uniref:Zinc-binding dehydrogenase n=1 Tax=Acrodontium crateriforme TaxID=150365 RepID=A0AAQ3R352_9PEZI|nr:zinc-binding dehydrogenase [Acrodontium crateriforme]